MANQVINAKYSELDNLIPTLTAGTYDLTVDCTGVAASEFMGKYDSTNPIASPFGQKLKVALHDVYFNLIPTNVGSDVTKTNEMFYGCSSLKNMDTSEFTKVTNARSMFKGCNSLIGVTKLSSSLTHTNEMFYGCSSLTSIDVSGLSSVGNASDMFCGCSSLTNIIWIDFFPSAYYNMFSGCNQHINIEVDYFTRTFITANAIDMSLVNYTLTGGEEKPDIPEIISYNDLSKTLRIYEPREEPYNLTVDCSGVDNQTLKSFSSKFNAALAGVYFNLTPTNVETDVTDATELFYMCRNLKSIDTSAFTSVTNTGYMFYSCSNLKEVTGTNVVTSVTNAERMFDGCSSLTSIDTSAFTNVTNAESMFNNCSSLTSIDTSAFTNVTNARSMFSRCSSLTSIDTSAFTSVTNTGYMFYSCRNLKEVTGTSGLTKVTDANNMFRSCSSLTSIDISTFTKVINASNMFAVCSSLTSIDTSAFTSVTNADSMFDGCSSLTSITWGDSFRPTDFNNMFIATNTTKTIKASDESKSWIENNATTMSLTNYTIIISFKVKYNELATLIPTLTADTYDLTVNCEGVDNQTLKGFGSKLKAAPEGVYFNLTPTNVGSDVTDTRYMFENCSNLTSIDISVFTKVTNANYMFQNCSSLTNIVWKNLIPTNYSSMFYNCPQAKNIEVDWYTRKLITDNHTSMSLENYTLTGGDVKPDIPKIVSYNDLRKTMLLYDPRTEPYNLIVDCEGVAASEFRGNDNTSSFGLKLKTAQEGVYFNLTPTNVGNDVTDASNMFKNCNSLASIDISEFTSVTNAYSMFKGCSSLTSIDTSVFTSVTDANNMFRDCSSLKEVTGTNVFTKVTDAGYMFYGCSNLTSINTSAFISVNNAQYMFQNCSSLTNIVWKNLLPTSYRDMFLGCPQAKNIEVDWFTRTYLTDYKISNMNLENYTLIGGDGDKPAIPEILPYNDLKKSLMFLYDPRPEPYDLTVDCTGVAASEFIGDDYNASLFGSKLNTAPSGVYFNLTLINIGNDITNTSSMFHSCDSLTSINTSVFTNITNAKRMFQNCDSLTSIDTSAFTNVTNVENMFYGCSSLTNITWGDSFRPTQFKYMFDYVIAIKTISCSTESATWINNNASTMALDNYIFGEKDLSLTYEQLDTELANIEPHYTYNLTVDCEGVAASEFIGVQDNTSPFGQKLKDAQGVFFNLTLINIGSDITNVSSMFRNCNNLTSIDTGGFTSITNTSSIFYGCSNLSNINTSGLTNVTNAMEMFYGCSRLTNIDTSGFTNVTDAGNMFAVCSSLTSIDTSGFTSVTNAGYMFCGCGSLTEVTGLSKLTSLITAHNMFSSCSKLTSIDVSGLTSVTDASSMFFWCESLTNIVWTDFFPFSSTYMFDRCSQSINIEVDYYTRKFITANAGNMSLSRYNLIGGEQKPKEPSGSIKYSDLLKEMMLYDPRPEPYDLTVDCTGINNRTLRIFSVYLSTVASGVYFNLKPINLEADVTDATGMFQNCNSLTSIDTSAFTSVTNASNMFSDCSSLTKVTGTSGFTNVTNADHMFDKCSNLTSIDTSAFTKVTNATNMFSRCSELTNITWGDSFRPTNFSSMFYGISKIITITASADSETWIRTNASAMSLTNYDMSAGDFDALLEHLNILNNKVVELKANRDKWYNLAK